MAFTITLPSNSSMNVFPENTLTTYNTLLPEYVSSPVPLECALQEITCPTSWYNVLPETIVVIEGDPVNRPSSNKSGSTKRLQDILMKRAPQFFPRTHRTDLLLNRSSVTTHHSTLEECLQRGVQISRTQHGDIASYVPPNPPVDPKSHTAAPPGGTPVNHAAAGDDELIHEGSEDETRKMEITSKEEAAEEVQKADDHVEKVSDAVAEVSEALKTLAYDEVGVFLTPPGVTLGLTNEQLRSVKHAIKIKALDKLVRELNFPTRRTYKVFSLTGVYLRDNADLISYLNKYFNKRNPAIVRELKRTLKNPKSQIFTYNRFRMKCTISLPPNVILQIPTNLGMQLGFGGGVFLIGKTEGHSVVDLLFRAQTAYVYSDIVKHSIVGDKRAPLLRVVNINPYLGDTQTVTFQPLIYQPLSRSSFRQIAVYLRDSTGQPIPFERGAVTVVLALRPVSPLQH